MRLIHGLVVLVVSVLVRGADAGLFFSGYRTEYGSVSPPAPSASAQNVKTVFFAQALDHFGSGPGAASTWPQRLMYNTDLVVAGTPAPVFIYIGAEGVLSANWLTGGFVYEAAKSHNAVVLAVEHRYYGMSHPTEDLSRESLRLLTSRQALADVANIIKQFVVDGTPVASARVVVFGGSYGGSLSAWMRQLYPDLVTGAIAASAPLEPSVEFHRYYEVVEQSLWHEGSDACVTNLREALATVSRMLRRTGGPAQIERDFALCRAAPTPASPTRERESLFYSFTDRFAEIVQYHSAKDPFNIPAVCATLDGALTAYNGLVDVIGQWRARGGLPCLESTYGEMLESLTEPVPNWSRAGRQWMWQSCNEFGYFQVTGTALADESAVSPELFYKLCEDAYGIIDGKRYVNTAAEDTRKFYGGYNFTGSNVYFTNGNVDPWSALSLLEGSDERRYQALVTNSTAHCAILGRSDESTLVQDRHTLVAAIGGWIGRRAEPTEAVVSAELLHMLKL